MCTSKDADSVHDPASTTVSLPVYLSGRPPNQHSPTRRPHEYIYIRISGLLSPQRHQPPGVFFGVLVVEMDSSRHSEPLVFYTVDRTSVDGLKEPTCPIQPVAVLFRGCACASPEVDSSTLTSISMPILMISARRSSSSVRIGLDGITSIWNYPLTSFMIFFLFRLPSPAFPLSGRYHADMAKKKPFTLLAPSLDPSILPHNLRQLAILGDLMTAAEIARVLQSLPNLREFEFEISQHLPGPLLPSPQSLPNLERLQITASGPLPHTPT